jgi:Zn-dependent peptidase ImmA (M78 family)/DNA-binding XRE family transcriptional regulator
LTTKARVNCEILRWARDEAGLSLAVAAQKASVSEEKLSRWEQGADQPTIPQLRKLAQVYKRPLAAFYLPEVPTAFRVQTDFRRLPGEVADMYSPELRLDLRNAAYHRDVALELFRELGEEPPTFRFTASVDDDQESAGESLRIFLDAGEPVREEPRLAFNRWRRLVEDRGVLVFQMAHVEVGEMRGLSLATEHLPVVAVNRKDAWASRLFSLMHELSHIALRRGGICDIDEFARRPPEEQRVEQFCNHVAGAALVPRSQLLGNRNVRSHTGGAWEDDTLRLIASDFGVSREVVLRRLLILGRTTEAAYRKARQRFIDEYVARAEATADEEGGFARNMPRETLGLLGRSFVGLVLDTYEQDRITLNDVATYLGVRVKHLDNIARLVKAG